MHTMESTLPLHTRAALRPALVMAAIALLGFGLLYSLAGTGLGRALFPQQATGSLIKRDGSAVASLLVAQPFADARYLQPRPSAANYDPMAAAGSNQARTNPEAIQRITDTRADVAARDGIAVDAVAPELTTQSGGGLDPDISPAAAQQQVARIARARGLDEAIVRKAIADATQAPQFGLLGPARVNVVRANLALDAHR